MAVSGVWGHWGRGGRFRGSPPPRWPFPGERAAAQSRMLESAVVTDRNNKSGASAEAGAGAGAGGGAGVGAGARRGADTPASDALDAATTAGGTASGTCTFPRSISRTTLSSRRSKDARSCEMCTLNVLADAIH